MSNFKNIFALVFVVNVGVWSENVSDTRDSSNWFEDFPVFPTAFAKSDLISDPTCKKDCQLYINNLKNFTLWATSMFDSSTKMPTGVLGGRVFDLGNFDECLSARADYGNGGILKGEYCLFEIHYHLKNTSKLTEDPFKLTFNQMKSAWEMIQYRGDYTKVRKDIITSAICIPSSCAGKEIQTVMTNELKPLAESHEIEFYIHVPHDGCTVRNDWSLSSDVKAFCAVVIILFLLIITATVVDGLERTLSKKFLNETIKNVLDCFSMINNLEKLLVVNADETSRLNIIHAIKVIMLLNIIHGHRVFQHYGHPIVESYFLEYTYRDPSYFMLYNGLVIVDAFFAMSSTLIVYHLMKKISERKSINLFYVAVLRYVRLVPLYMLVVFFNATVLWYLGDGPFWKKIIGLERDRCVRSWWTSLVMINNYYEPENICMFTSWYISVDYHLFIVGMLITYIIAKFKYIGYCLLGAMTVVSNIIPILVMYHQKSEAFLRITPELTDVRLNSYFQNIYIPSHMRASPYMLGIITGLILFKFKFTNRLSTITSWVLIISLLVTAHIPHVLGYYYMLPSSPTDPLSNAIFNNIQRLVYTGSICSIILVIVYGDVEHLRKIMSSRLFIIMSRLAYGAYLVHFIPQIFDLGIQRSPRYFHPYIQIWNTIGDLVVTYVASLILAMLVEYPAKNLISKYLK